MNKSLLILIQIVVATLYATNAAPTATNTNAETPSQAQNAAAAEVQLVQAPQVVTLAHLESLLRRAGEIFRPAIYQSMTDQAEQTQPQEQAQEAPQQQQQQQAQLVSAFVAVPFEYMQPPNDQPYNYYLPLYDNVDEDNVNTQKLDAKSSKFTKITPPPKSASSQPNYYAMKPKKVAKKFNAALKHINMKWLNVYEKETGLELPKESYLVNDERNRINFDDSFFAVDMLVKAPATNEQPKSADSSQQQDDYQTEDGEDLMAAAAAQVTQISLA